MVISFRMFRATGTMNQEFRISWEDWDLGSECNCQIRVCNASRLKWTKFDNCRAERKGIIISPTGIKG